MRSRSKKKALAEILRQALSLSLSLSLLSCSAILAQEKDPTGSDSPGETAQPGELVPPPDKTDSSSDSKSESTPVPEQTATPDPAPEPKTKKKEKSASKKKKKDKKDKAAAEEPATPVDLAPQSPDATTSEDKGEPQNNENAATGAEEKPGPTPDEKSEEKAVEKSEEKAEEAGDTGQSGGSKRETRKPASGTADDAVADEDAVPKKKKFKKPEHISEADRLLLENKFEEAEEAYRALVTDDETGDAYAGLAVALAKQQWPKKVLEAERIVRKGNEEFPENPNMMAAAAFVALEHSRTVSSPAKRDLYVEAAEKLSKRALRDNPEIAIAQQTLGLAKMAQDDPEGAIKPFRSAARIAEDPVNLTLWAEALLRVNPKDSKADEIIEEVLSQDPDYNPARLQKAIILTNKGKHEEAFTELHTIPRDERESDWQNVQGDIFRKQGDGASALASWKEANRLNPRNPEPYKRMGEYYAVRGDGELAISEWHNALEILPNDMKMRSQMAELALRLDKLEVAEQEYRTILNVKPDDPKALLGLSRVYFRKARREGGQYPPDFQALMNHVENVLAEQSVTGEVVKGAANLRENIQLSEAEKALTQKRFREAGNLFNQVIEKNRDDPYNLLTLAEQAYNDGDLKTAERAYGYAREIPEVAPRAEQGISKIISQRTEANRHTKLGDATWKLPEVAMDHYKQALVHDPQHPPAYYGLFSLMCKKKDDPEKAMDYGNCFLEASDDADPLRKEVEENLSKLKKRVDKENSK
ncbi:MAG: hypothetical protein KC777_02080 [Cyanobacteria bacterium HKST-UBA02]|nr:hypothetical protein [Cyanobacteria bacterium HKST-UBA02]